MEEQLSDGEFVFASEPCSPIELLKYDLATMSWSVVARPPNTSPRYSNLLFVDWSPDGHWVAWMTINRVLIYDTETWNIVREYKAEANQGFLSQVWAYDINRNSILSVFEHDYAHPPESSELLGLSPNGTQVNDRRLIKILREPDWLPIGSAPYIDYYPLSWQP
jgi:Tol biopolymer transport system component